MSDNYEQMSNDELREEIADRLGWVNLDWDDNTLFGDNPSGMHNPENTPNYPQDCNAALELLKDMPEYVLQWSAICWQWRVRPIAGVMNYALAAHETPARAICIAWLLWQDAQEAK